MSWARKLISLPGQLQVYRMQGSSPRVLTIPRTPLGIKQPTKTTFLHTTSARFPQRDPVPTMADERATGLKANKGIELLTFGTPNGVKASILLEELKETYGKVRLALLASPARNGAAR